MHIIALRFLDIKLYMRYNINKDFLGAVVGSFIVILTSYTPVSLWTLKRAIKD